MYINPRKQKFESSLLICLFANTEHPSTVLLFATAQHALLSMDLCRFFVPNRTKGGKAHATRARRIGFDIEWRGTPGRIGSGSTVIVDISPNGYLARQGEVRVGDSILAIDNILMPSPDDVTRALTPGRYHTITIDHPDGVSAEEHQAKASAKYAETSVIGRHQTEAAAYAASAAAMLAPVPAIDRCVLLVATSARGAARTTLAGLVLESVRGEGWKSGKANLLVRSHAMEKCVVKTVLSHSPAACDGTIRPGDLIIAIDHILAPTPAVFARALVPGVVHSVVVSHPDGVSAEEYKRNRYFNALSTTKPANPAGPRDAYGRVGTAPRSSAAPPAADVDLTMTMGTTEL